MRVSVAMAVVAVGLVVTACGGSSNSPASDSGASGASSGYAHSQVAQFTAVPEFVPPGPAFDATKAKGKKIFEIPLSSQIPFINDISKSMADVAKRVGAHFTDLPNQGKVDQYVRSMQLAISQKADLIVLNSVNPALIQPQVKAAKAAGIKIVATHQPNPKDYPSGTLNAKGMFDNVDAIVYAPYIQSAKLEADYAIDKSGGKANVLVMTANDDPPSRGMGVSIEQEIQKRCSGCKVSKIDVPIAQWATNLQSQTQSALLKNPNIDWIIPVYDSMAAMIAPGIQAAGKTGKVRVVGFNGTNSILKMIQDADVVAADVGENPRWLGMIDMDQALRLLSGQPTTADSIKEGIRIFDDSNVTEVGKPPVSGQGYGSQYETGFNKLWGLG